MTRGFLWTVIALVGFLASTSTAQRQDVGFLGIMLDRTPLPEILIRHLGLQQGKGLRIENICEDSPADQAGLERDDILLTVNGHDVNDVRHFGRIIGRAGVGSVVRLEVIQKGHRQTIEIKLAQRPKEPRWKYPPEPRAMMGWRIGGIFRQDPQSGRWVPFDQLQDANTPPPPLPFPREVYTFNYGDGADRVSVVIEGNPRSNSAKVTVRAGQAEYTSTIDQIDKLPAIYRDQVSQAIQRARRESDRQRDFGPLREWDRGRGGRGGPDSEWSDRQWFFLEGVIDRTLDAVARYLEAVERSSRPIDKSQMERLNQIEQQLRQLQEQIEKAQQQQHDRTKQ
ncbi:MAG: PDZ domain-containing protein [Sedimentisphaerales bacterium]|nr:PDZ domain-containing protein [Sedimentisphaerales bacterium]